MRKSSINFRKILPNSESHNQRLRPMEHVDKNLTENNEQWIVESCKDRFPKIVNLYQQKAKKRYYDKVNKLAEENPNLTNQEVVQLAKKKFRQRLMMPNTSQPIREAVVNLEARHTMEDLKKLAETLRIKKGLHCFQIYIHRDEGYKDKKTGEFETNYHGHMIFDWQNKATGQMNNLNRLDLAEVQSIVADTLGMERGKEGSKAVRLEAQAYKANKRLEELEDDIIQLEIKKKILQNELKAQEEQSLMEHRLWEERRQSRENKLLQLYGQTNDKLQNAKENLNDYRNFLKKTDQQWRKQLEELMKSLENRKSILKNNNQLIKQSKIEKQNLEQQLKDLEAVQSTKSVRHTVIKKKSIDDDMSL